MEEKYIKIVNNITNYYKDAINLLPKEDKNKEIIITLADFGLIKLILKNINREKVYYDLENYDAVENGPIQITKVEDRYLVATVGKYKDESVVFTYKCDYVDFQLELYNYTNISINKKYISHDYRIKLGNKIAHNLLMKHATLGDEYLDKKEKDILPVAMWISIMDSSQSFVKAPDCNKIFDLFIQYNDRYEKEEFLNEALKLEEYYKDIKEVQKICKIMRSCLNKLETSQNRGVYSKMEETLVDYISIWHNLEPVYKVYVDFTNYIKDTCKSFKNNLTLNMEIEQYIKEQVGKKLIEAGFEEEYPYYRIKTEDKIYVLEFEIINYRKVKIKMLQEILDESDELMALLELMDYKYLLPEDIDGWDEEVCKNKEEIDEEIETILDCLLVDKVLFKQTGKFGLIGGVLASVISYLLWNPSILVCGVIGIITYMIVVTIEKYGRMAFAILKEEEKNENE